MYNDRDEEFPAQCNVLFQKHAEFYLNPEFLARRLIQAAKEG